MKNSFRSLTICIVIVMLLTACAGSVGSNPKPEDVILKLNWKPSIQFLGFYVADHQGFFAEEGLNVTIKHVVDVEEIPTIFDKVEDGTYDYSIGGSALITAQANGSQVTVISSTLQLSPFAFFTRTDEGIVTPSDMVGHSVGVKGTGWRILLENFLATADLTLDDVEVVEVSFDMTPFIEGEVDIWPGFLTDEVVRARQQGIDVVTFPLYEYGINPSSLPLFVSHDLLNEKEEQTVRFTRAAIRGWEWAMNNPTEAIDILVDRYPELASDREFHLASFEAFIPLMSPVGVHIGNVDCEQWNANDSFADLDSKELLCTTSIFDEAVRTDKTP